MALIHVTQCLVLVNIWLHLTTSSVVTRTLLLLAIGRFIHIVVVVITLVHLGVLKIGLRLGTLVGSLEG